MDHTLLINEFIKGDKTREIVTLSDNQIPKLNYPGLFFEFNKIKGSQELVLSKYMFIYDIDVLKKYVDEFMTSDKEKDVVNINNSLRRIIRNFKNLYPELHYFAKYTHKFYELILSKNKFQMEFSELELKTRKMYIEYSGVKIDPNIDRETHKLLNPYLELDNKFKELSDLLWDLGGEQEFINKHYAIIKDVARVLGGSDKLKDWINCAAITNKPRFKPRNQNVYQKDNDRAYFISIDMKSANYQILHLNGLIEETWAEFLQQFTPHAYYHKSKFLRLKCLSHASLEPKKQKQVWMYNIIEILNSMIDDNIVSAENIAALNSDEIIIATHLDNMIEQQESYRNYLSAKFSNLALAVELFQLKQVGKYYMKMDPTTHKLNFKCVNAKQLPELVAALNKSPK